MDPLMDIQVLHKKDLGFQGWDMHSITGVRSTPYYCMLCVLAQSA